MKISIIIPNFNGEKILGKNLPKVLESVNGDLFEAEIIITDDASTDKSVEIINKFIDENKNKKTKIKLITADKNKGFSSNVNLGVKNSTGEILILLNTDVIPKLGFLSPLLKPFDDEKVFGVGCMDESVEQDKIVLRGRGKGKWQRGFLTHSAASIEGTNTLWVSGGSGAFRKDVWEKMGGLDESFNPFYWEDIDLSYRALKSGYKTLFEKKSIVRHEHEKGIIKTKYKSSNIKKIVYRNQFIFTWKNADFGTLISHIFWLPYHLIKAVVDRDKEFIIGLFYALKRLPITFKSRRKSRKLFIRTDKEVTSVI